MGKKTDWNIFIGGMTGVIKGLNISLNGMKNVKNLINVQDIDNKKEITRMCWSNENEKELLIGYCDQAVKIFNVNSQCFTFEKYLDCGEGSIKGLSIYNGNIITAVESGEIKLWNVKKKIKSEKDAIINAGKCLESMCHSKLDKNFIATGGKENELKLWDLEKGTNTFTAKNVRPDELQLRVPVWVSDITFLPDSLKMATCSRYGFVRLYDPNSSFRRPIININVPDQAFTCISSSSREGHVLVGSGTGHMFLVDLRNKGVLLNHYKGFLGGIRQIACAPNEPYIVSVGLDRHVRVHDLNSKQLLAKEYLQSRLTCVLMKSNFTMFKTDDNDDEEVVIENENEFEIKKEKGSEDDQSDKEYEELFSKMETIGGGKRKSKLPIKKKRKKLKE